MLLGLLLFPSTCADAAMVHSIFTDPTTIEADGHRQSSHAAHAAALGMSEVEYVSHVAMGHILVSESDVPTHLTQSSTQASLADPCLAAPKFRNLPNEMLINVATVVAVVDESVMPDVPAAAEQIGQIPVFPSDLAIDIESPPPR